MLSWCAATLLMVLPSALLGKEATSDGWEDVYPFIVVATHVDATGQVAQAELLGTGALPQLEALAIQTVKPLRFVPATINGVATSSLTYVMLRAQKHEDAGKFSLRLHYVSHGPGPAFDAYPHYPKGMIQARTQAQVTIAATVTAAGTYTDIHVVEAETTGGRAGKSFYDATMRAFSQTHVMPEQVDGRPVATHVRIPVSFSLNEIGGSGAYEELRRASDSPRSISPDDRNVPTTFADVPIALDSPLKLVATPP